MSYAIGEFRFGLNLKEYNDFYISDVIKEDIDSLSGFELLGSSYNGSGDQPLFLGVNVSEIDECDDLAWYELEIIRSKLKAAMEPDSKERQQYKKLLQAILDEPEITDETKEWFKSQEPEVFLTWASS